MKKFLLIISVIFSLFITRHVESGALIFQIVLAEKWFKVIQKYDMKQKQDFVSGMLIQNIDYIEDHNFNPVIEENVSLEDVLKSETPFDAGQLFYNFIFRKKQRHIDRWGVYRHLTGISENHMPSFLKLLEDELLYDPQICSQAAGYLSAITAGEIMTGIEIEKLAVWHGILYKYFSEKPSLGLASLKDDKRIKFPVTSEGIDIWKAALVFLSTNEKIKQYLEDLVGEFDTAFEIFRLKYLK